MTFLKLYCNILFGFWSSAWNEQHIWWTKDQHPDGLDLRKIKIGSKDQLKRENQKSIKGATLDISIIKQFFYNTETNLH